MTLITSLKLFLMLFLEINPLIPILVSYLSSSPHVSLLYFR